MADPFQDTPPALDTEEDPAAEFLAREQDQLAGIDDGDDFTFGEPAATDQSNSNQAFDDFGGQPSDPQPDMLEDDFGLSAAPDTTADSMQNGLEDKSPYSAISSLDRVRTEPEKIRIWREEQAQRLTEKDAAEEKQIEEWRVSAQKELEDWYKHREEQLAKTKDTNRAAEEAYVKEIEDKEPGSEWERVCRLCDFNPKNSKNTRDVSRLRSILLQLKQSGLQR